MYIIQAETFGIFLHDFFSFFVWLILWLRLKSLLFLACTNKENVSVLTWKTVSVLRGFIVTVKRAKFTTVCLNYTFLTYITEGLLVWNHYPVWFAVSQRRNCPGELLYQRKPTISRSLLLGYFTSPWGYIHQCPLLHNTLHKSLRKAAGNFGCLPWGLKPFPSRHPWRGKRFTACLLCFFLGWAARKSVLVC